MAPCLIKIGHARVYTVYIQNNLVRVYIIPKSLSYPRKHTAVKIWPAYPDLTIYVPDASRAVNVATSLVNKDAKYLAGVRKLYEKVQADHSKTMQVLVLEIAL